MPASSSALDTKRQRPARSTARHVLVLLTFFLLAACSSQPATQTQAPVSAAGSAPMDLSGGAKLTTQRMASSPAWCPSGPFLFTVASDGAQFRGQDQAGTGFSAPVAPDGTVNLRYRTVGGRAALITGNARTGALQLAAGPNDACRYAFAPAAADATPGTAVAWRASQTLIAGIPRNCGDPPFPDYVIRVSGKTLFADPEGGETQSVRGYVLDLAPLRADGSGRVTATSRRDTAWHYDFEAGSGARKFTVRRDSGECAYQYRPI